MTRTRTAEWGFTAGIALLALAWLLRPVLPALAGPLAWLAELYFFGMEALFWFSPTGEGIVAVSVAVLALPLALSLGRPLLQRLPSVAAQVITHAGWGFVGVLVLIAQCYLLAFAAKAELGLLVFLTLWLGVEFSLLFRDREADESTRGLRGAPLGPTLLMVGAYLLLGMVAGHLATPLVHALAASMARLSHEAAWVYRLVVIGMLLAPTALWLRRPFPAPRRWWALGLPVLAALALLPTGLSIYLVSVVAGGLAAALSARSGWLGLPHPHPAVLAQRLMLPAMLALNAVTVHYAMDMWRCPNEERPGVRQLSAQAGTFDLAVQDGRLLASLREPRRLLQLLVATGAHRSSLPTDGLVDDTGSRFSWVEPETLLPLPDGRRALLLLAVSDDESANRVAVVDTDLRVQRLLDLPRTSIADLIADGRGRIYLSTEFDDQVLALNVGTLEGIAAVRWPGAETNKILAWPERQRLYSLGLWTDPMLRALDLRSGQEVDALEVGTRSWDMALDEATSRLFVPRMLSGDVLVVDADALDLLDRWDAGFGARPVEVDPAGRLLYVGNMYDGRVRVYDLDTGETVFETYLGGYIKSLAVDPVSGRAYCGCACGIFELDPRGAISSR